MVSVGSYLSFGLGLRDNATFNILVECSHGNAICLFDVKNIDKVKKIAIFYIKSSPKLKLYWKIYYIALHLHHKQTLTKDAFR